MNITSSLILLAGLSLVPFAFMTLTSFAKISVVFSILRNALGVGQVPSGMLVAAISAVLTLYVMSPVGGKMMDAAAITIPQIARSETLQGQNTGALFDIIDKGKEPLRDFLKRNASKREVTLFLDLARRVRAPEERGSVHEKDFLVVLPAFLITELTEAFQIGFVIFLPFLVIDMIVANILLALGMHMLNPTTISLPFKLLLFVLVDGWYLLSRALVLGYV